MSLNVGQQDSKYVVVSNVTMRYAYSEKVLFAELRTSRKTGRYKTDKGTGEVIIGADGNPIPERAYQKWEGRFVGNAFEAAKGLGNGQAINIVNGWMDREEKTAGSGKTYSNVFVVITDFEVSDISDDDVSDEAEAEDVSDNATAYLRALNGDDNIPANGGVNY